MKNQPTIEPASEKDVVIVRELTASDMGWFRDSTPGMSGYGWRPNAMEGVTK